MIHEVVVTEVLPKVAGVRVRFRDLVPTGFNTNDYVRVLSRRMSATGGASLDLPVVGEHGVVAGLAGGIYVWLGSFPYRDANQVDPTPGIAYARHESGVVSQVRDNGDFEIAHPSGFRVTVSTSGGAMPDLQASSAPAAFGGETPFLSIVHPSGTSIQINPGGDILVTGAGLLSLNAPGGVAIASDGPISIASPSVILAGVTSVNGVPGGMYGPAGPTGPTGPAGSSGATGIDIPWGTP